MFTILPILVSQISDTLLSFQTYVSLALLENTLYYGILEKWQGLWV